MRSLAIPFVILSACAASPHRSTQATAYGGAGDSAASYAAEEPAVGRPMSPPSSSSSSYSSSSGAPDSVAVSAPSPAPSERPGLGTVWGEDVYAPVTVRPFERAARDPWATAVLHYNDSEGVAAMARYYGGTIAPLEVYAGDGSIGVSLVSEAGSLLPGISANGAPLIVGEDGSRYRIVVRNGTTARFEIVTSVDGLDVIDGQPADPQRRGYILEPHGELVIDGFRRTDASVAAFRFGRVADSYAARTSGDSNVGVIGVAIFPERGAVWTPAELSRRFGADPFPARTYATPP